MSKTLEIAWPDKEGEYLDMVSDSTRWNGFAFRDGDVVVATYGKSGTTMTQHILAQIINGPDPELYGGAEAVSPWVDFRHSPNREVADAQAGRRILKTHLARQHLPISPKARYVVVCRDLRDVAWSFHNHMHNFAPDYEAALDASNDGARFKTTDDVRAYYHAFLDGVAVPKPFGPFMRGWWEARHLPNVRLIHFADIIADMPREILRLAEFIGAPLSEATAAAIAPLCTLDHMRRIATDDPIMNRAFKSGSATFFNKGTNGRWRDVLTQAEIDKADIWAAQELAPECAAWLRTGGDLP